jgi:hypothetical protein
LYRKLLRDARFFELLLKIDEEKLEALREKRCPYCGGPLHSGHFCRKPRGIGVRAEELPDGYEVRFDLCCGWCRKRTMPESVRFLGRKVYLGVVVAVGTVLARGADRGAMRLLRRQLGVSWSTVKRWCTWWRELTGSAFWQRIRGTLPVDLDLGDLPRSVLESFDGDSAERMQRMLRLLGPITGGGPGHARGEPIIGDRPRAEDGCQHDRRDRL